MTDPIRQQQIDANRETASRYAKRLNCTFTLDETMVDEFLHPLQPQEKQP